MAPLLASVLALIALALPGAALGQGITVPPGQSEADQYFETIPDGQGEKSLDGGRQPSDVLTDRQLAQLEELGEVGVAAAQLAAASAPVPAGDGGRTGAGSSRSGAGAGTGAGAGNEGAGGADPGAGAAALAAAPTRDGLGWLLWAILVASAALLALYGLARRRERPQL